MYICMYKFVISDGYVVGVMKILFLTQFHRQLFGFTYVSMPLQPLSSMSPILVFRRAEGDESTSSSHWGNLVLALGGSGGPKIISAVLQVILNYCFLGMSLYESVARPRLHDQLIYHDAIVTESEKSVLEQGPTIEVSQRTKDALLNRGHSQLVDIDYAGTVQAVAIDLETKTLSAVSDIRKGGAPDGF